MRTFEVPLLYPDTTPVQNCEQIMKSRMLLDSEELASFPVKVPTVLDNVSCVYCAAGLSKETRTKEHVVARRFVPRGKHDGGWNLIAYACTGCNNAKARLENELAAISMQPDSYGKYAIDDDLLKAEATRKAAKSISSRTGRPINESGEQLKFETRHPAGLLVSVSLEAPAQVSSEVVFELCRMQMCAFFYMLTFDRNSRRGGFWPGIFMGIQHAKRSDWGSRRLVSFAETVKEWEPRLICTTPIADGFYKLSIRKHPSEDCWSWAVEWNHSIRCVGLFGEESSCENVEKALEKNVAQLFVDEPHRKLAYRRDVALIESDDVLFKYRDIDT